MKEGADGDNGEKGIDTEDHQEIRFLMDRMFGRPPNSYIEALTPNMITF